MTVYTMPPSWVWRGQTCGTVVFTVNVSLLRSLGGNESERDFFFFLMEHLSEWVACIILTASKSLTILNVFFLILKILLHLFIFLCGFPKKGCLKNNFHKPWHFGNFVSIFLVCCQWQYFLNPCTKYLTYFMTQNSVKKKKKVLSQELSCTKLKPNTDHPLKTISIHFFPKCKCQNKTVKSLNGGKSSCNLCSHFSEMCASVCDCVKSVRTFSEICDGRLNSALNSASLSISSIDSLASTFCLCPLPVITCPVTASHSPVSDYIVRWLELGKHEMEVTLILIQVFNGVFYLRVSLLSHFRWAASLRADCPGHRSL